MIQGEYLLDFKSRLNTADARQQHQPVAFEIDPVRENFAFAGYNPFRWDAERKVVIILQERWDLIEKELLEYVENYDAYTGLVGGPVTAVFGIPVSLYTPDTIILGQE